MPRFERPSAISAEDLALARRQLVERSRLARRPTMRCTTSGSSAEPPRATRRTASMNSARVADAVLEQVADAVGAVADQLERVAVLEELGQHDDARPRAARRGSRCAARRPSSVRSGGIWMSVMTTSGLCAPACAAGPGRRQRRRRPQARLLEDTHDALADERLVLADDHADRRAPPRANVSAAWEYPKPRSEGCPMGNAAAQT